MKFAAQRLCSNPEKWELFLHDEFSRHYPFVFNIQGIKINTGTKVFGINAHRTIERRQGVFPHDISYDVVNQYFSFDLITRQFVATLALNRRIGIDVVEGDVAGCRY